MYPSLSSSWLLLPLLRTSHYLFANLISSLSGSDGVPSLVQLRTPTTCNLGPVSLGGYSYSIMKIGPLQFTRKGLSVSSTAACLTFTVSLFPTISSNWGANPTTYDPNAERTMLKVYASPYQYSKSNFSLT
ncbi:hypothetical protein Q3G72_005784 [Acer saccharum]|nr:hypothetical protein Q3G72_005784 [Acer saccharum]